MVPNNWPDILEYDIAYFTIEKSGFIYHENGYAM